MLTASNARSVTVKWKCESTTAQDSGLLRFDSYLDVTIGRVAVGAPKQRSRRARREPSADQQMFITECLDDRAKPAAQVADLGGPPREQGHESAGPGSGAEKMCERMRPLRELDGFDPGLIEQHTSLENIHRRSVEARPEVHELSPTVGGLPLHDGRRGFAGEPGRVQQIIIGQQADRSGPLERCQRGFDRTARRVIEGEQSGSLICAKQQVRETFGAVEEGSYRQRPGRRHKSKLSRAQDIDKCLTARNLLRIRSAEGDSSAVPAGRVLPSR